MRALLISFVVDSLFGGVGVFATPANGTSKPGPALAIPTLAIPILKSPISFDQSLSRTGFGNALFRGLNILATSGTKGNRISPYPGGLKNFTIESFGYNPGTPQAFAVSP